MMIIQLIDIIVLVLFLLFLLGLLLYVVYNMGYKYGYSKGIEEASAIQKGKIREMIYEIKKWYFDADKQELAKDPCVVDAMVDLFIRTIHKYFGKE